VIVRAICGDPDVLATVTVADLSFISVFAKTSNVNTPSPEPVAGLTFNHDAFEDADHDMFDSTHRDVEPADHDESDHEPHKSIPGGDG